MAAGWSGGGTYGPFAGDGGGEFAGHFFTRKMLCMKRTVLHVRMAFFWPRLRGGVGAFWGHSGLGQALGGASGGLGSGWGGGLPGALGGGPRGGHRAEAWGGGGGGGFWPYFEAEIPLHETAFFASGARGGGRSFLCSGARGGGAREERTEPQGKRRNRRQTKIRASSFSGGGPAQTGLTGFLGKKSGFREKHKNITPLCLVLSRGKARFLGEKSGSGKPETHLCLACLGC